jgi:glycosyltransferase involved in cell wall biosynthesis
MTARPAAEKEPVPTVVFIGRLSANKRPKHAIRAFGLVHRQIPDAQMWVIGSGPEEARLRRTAGPGVTFLGHVPEEEKHERLARAHALIATSVREGWGLVVTEAAASGTVSIGYDVPGLRDSIGASGGVLTRADPASLATGLVGLLLSVAGGYGPRVRPAGVVPWAEVAAAILAVAHGARSPVVGPADCMTDRDPACRSDAADCVPQTTIAASGYVLRQRAPSDFQEEVLER